MADLEEYINQVKLVCAFIQNPTFLIDRIEKILNEKNELQHARVLKIYNIYSNYITESFSNNELFLKLTKPSSDEVHNLALSVKEKNLTDEKSLTNLKNQLNSLAQLMLSHGIEVPTINLDASEPIHPSDQYYLSKLSRSSLTEDNDGFTEKELKSLEFKNRIFELYQTVPSYFEQAFSNTEIKIQGMILDYIRERYSASDINQTKELNNLNDLYMLSDIDQLAIKMKENNVALYQAFQKFTLILAQNEKSKLINKIIKDNIIMSALFKIEGKGSLQGLNKLFISAQYPYNGLILFRYKTVMGKSDTEMNEVINTLKKDPEFAKKYNNFLNTTETFNKKRKIENFLQTIDSYDRLKLRNEIIENYDILMDENLSEGAISFNDILSYSRQMNEAAIKNNLHLDKLLTEKTNKFFIYKLEKYLNSKKKEESKSVIYGIDSLDVWYDMNVIMAENNVDSYEKIYLKYDSKFAYEFKPFHPLQVSRREMAIPEIRALPDNQNCVICYAGEDGRFNLLDLYINRLYQRMFKVALKDKIKVNVKEAKKGSTKDIFTTSDENMFKKIIHDYCALSFIIQKDFEFFKNFYRTKAKEVLTDILNFDKTDEVINENVILETTYDYKDLFKNRDLVKKILSTLNDEDIKTNMQEFVKLVSNNLELKNNLKK